MSDSPWKTLLETAKARGRARRLTGVGTDHPDRPSLEQEILSEMAYSLRRAERKLVRAIEAAEAALKRLSEVPPEERQTRLELADLRHREAHEARWELVVHREAIGFLRHDDLDEIYPMPPRP